MENQIATEREIAELEEATAAAARMYFREKRIKREAELIRPWMLHMFGNWRKSP